MRNMVPIDEIRLLHRHGDQWSDMRPAHHAPADHDIERELVKGARVFECGTCEMRFRVEDASGEDWPEESDTDLPG
jgi:hypothetical protein